MTIVAEVQKNAFEKRRTRGNFAADVTKSLVWKKIYTHLSE